jgi:adenylyl- and sulfurtransferase ThiI
MIQDNNSATPVIASEQFVVDRKKFYVDLKENARGRFYKITEDVGGRRDTVMVPAESVQELIDALSRLASIEQSLPPA